MFITALTAQDSHDELCRCNQALVDEIERLVNAGLGEWQIRQRIQAMLTPHTQLLVGGTIEYLQGRK